MEACFWNCHLSSHLTLGRGGDSDPLLLIVLVSIIYLHTISSGQ